MSYSSMSIVIANTPCRGGVAPPDLPKCIVVPGGRRNGAPTLMFIHIVDILL